MFLTGMEWQVYGLSGPVARYIGRNGPILHRFANEDVTLGAWLVGLEVTHVDDRRFCCDSAERCMAQVVPPHGPPSPCAASDEPFSAVSCSFCRAKPFLRGTSLQASPQIAQTCHVALCRICGRLAAARSLFRTV